MKRLTVHPYDKLSTQIAFLNRNLPSFGEDLHEVIGEISSGQIQTQDGVRQSVSFVDGDGVRHAVTRIQDDTGSTTRGVERQDSLDGDVHGWRGRGGQSRGTKNTLLTQYTPQLTGSVERLEHDLSHLLPVGFGVQWSLSQQNGMFFGGHTKLVVERVMPNLTEGVLDELLGIE